MRLVKMLSVVLVVAAATVAATTQAQSITQYAKAAWAAGVYPGGPNVGRYFGRAYAAPVYSAPLVAAAPAADGRRAFSAEPTALQPAAPIRAEVQRDARPVGRPASFEDLRRRIDADEAALRAVRAQLRQEQADVYTGGLTEAQMRALD